MSGKQKTRKSMAKRYKITGSQKILRARAAHRHRLVPKSKRQKTLAGMDQSVFPGDARNIRRGLFI